MKALLLGLFVATTTFAGTLDHWDKYNNPENLRDGTTAFEYSFSKIPLSGSMPSNQLAWSDTFWPMYLGTISARWQTPEYLQAVKIKHDKKIPYAFYKKLYTKAELQKMPASEINLLSPAEKYDIFVGNYSYPTVQEARNNAFPTTPYWQGICSGWAPAAINHPEPTPVTVTNADGITVSFYSTDLKGLLALYYDRFSEGYTSFLAVRCEKDIFKSTSAADSKACSDTNAGAFHLALANIIGVQKRGLVADIARDVEVWNQPVYAYESRIVEERKVSRKNASGTKRVILIETKMFFGDDDEEYVSLNPFGNGDGFKFDFEKYLYTLELDSKGNIIGGDWEGGDDVNIVGPVTEELKKKITYGRPDFLWTTAKAKFVGYYAPLAKLVK